MIKQTFWDKLIKDKHGKLALFLLPNPPLIGWFVCKILAYLPFSPSFKNGLAFTGMAFLFVWAYLELTAGATYLRRILGLVVLIISLIPMFI